MLNWNKRVIIHQRDHRKKECMLCGDYLLRNFGWGCTMGWLREAAPHAEPDLQSRAGYSLCWSILSQLGAQISFTFLMLYYVEINYPVMVIFTGSSSRTVRLRINSDNPVPFNKPLVSYRTPEAEYRLMLQRLASLISQHQGYWLSLVCRWPMLSIK